MLFFYLDTSAAKRYRWEKAKAYTFTPNPVGRQYYVAPSDGIVVFRYNEITVSGNTLCQVPYIFNKDGTGAFGLHIHYPANGSTFGNVFPVSKGQRFQLYIYPGSDSSAYSPNNNVYFIPYE